MNKTISQVPVLFVLLAMLVSCNGQSTTKESKTIQNDTTMKNQKVLVAYFSATGTTEAVARQLAEAAGGDLLKIEPQQPYTAADLDWTNKKSRSTIEMSDLKSRPAIAADSIDFANYQVVYLGFPIWWYTAPTIINTFIENHDFAGKTVIPFATSGSSDIDKSCKDLAKSYPNINWVKGKLLNGVSNDSLKNWVKQIQ